MFNRLNVEKCGGASDSILVRLEYDRTALRTQLQAIQVTGM